MKVEDVASYFKRNEILKEVKKIRQLPSVSGSNYEHTLYLEQDILYRCLCC